MSDEIHQEEAELVFRAFTKKREMSETQTTLELDIKRNSAEIQNLRTMIATVKNDTMLIEYLLDLTERT